MISGWANTPVAPGGSVVPIVVEETVFSDMKLNHSTFHLLVETNNPVSTLLLNSFVTFQKSAKQEFQESVSHTIQISHFTGGVDKSGQFGQNVGHEIQFSQFVVATKNKFFLRDTQHTMSLIQQAKEKKK